jgi:hypothetical protein
MSAHQPSEPVPAREGRDWIDAAIELASGATAVGMFAYGVALSYSVLHAIATAAGLPAWSATLWPLGFEAFMAASALNALAEQRRRHHLADWHRRVPWYPWTLTGLTAGGSLLLNWFHPAIPLDPPPGWLRSLVYGLPPLAAVFAWHLFLQRIAHRRPATARAEAGTVPAPDPARADPDPVPAPAAENAAAASRRRRGPQPSRPTRSGASAGTAVSAEPVERALAAARAFEAEQGRPISRDALGRALHVGNRTAGELLRAVRAAGPSAQDGRPTPKRGDRDGTVPAIPPNPAADTATNQATPDPAPVPASGRAAGNGTGPGGPAPSSPSPSRSPARVV